MNPVLPVVFRRTTSARGSSASEDTGPIEPGVLPNSGEDGQKAEDVQDLERLTAQIELLSEEAIGDLHRPRHEAASMEVLRRALSDDIAITLSRLQKVKDLLGEQDAVINAIRSRDPQGAQLAMRRHVQNVAQRLEQVLNAGIES